MYNVCMRKSTYAHLIIFSALVLSQPAPAPASLLTGNRMTPRGVDTLDMKVMVPAYFDPSSYDWIRMEAQALKMPGRLCAIANPNSGPGSSYDPSYKSVIDTMHADSGLVIGYVHTSYGTRSLSLVEADINSWYSFYPALDGIFIDEQPNTTGEESYYAQLYGYIKQKDSTAIVVTNPGINTIESYLVYNGNRISDVTCVFESYTGFNAWTPSSWCSKYDRDNFYVIPYDISSANWLNAVNRAASFNVGWIYCTDATLPNPYGALPSYFEEFCNYILTGIPPSPSTGTGSIDIDGEFNDWNGITPLSPSPGYPSSDPDAQIADVWATSDSSHLYLSYEVAGNLAPSTYYYHVFIDVDRDSAGRKSGYVYNDSASIGAEYMIENGSFYRYNGSGGSNWSWVSSPGLVKADSGGRTELSVPLSIFPRLDSSTTVQFLLEVNQAASPYATVNYAPVDYKNQYYVYTVGLLTDVSGHESVSPLSFTLLQNYPNPFNPSTVLTYTLPRATRIRLVVYDVLGRKVATIAEGAQSAGVHNIEFDGTSLSSGVYFCSLEAGNFVSIKKMLLLK